MTTTVVKGQIPKNWSQCTIENTINVPLEDYWNLFFQLNLEEIASVGEYEDLPKIIKTTPVIGDFSKVGDNRRVHFNNGQTILETLIEWKTPNSFSYELTEIEIDLRKVAKRARGTFMHYKLPNGSTRVVWTYGFEQKNFIFKWIINRYIKTTHRFWMKDTLAETKRLTEKMYHEVK